VGDVDGEGANDGVDELVGILFMARGPLGAASVLMLMSTRCCSLSAYIPEFALIGMSLNLIGGGLAGGTESTFIALRSLEVDGCCFALKAGSCFRDLLVEAAEGPDGGRRALVRRSGWLVSRGVAT
jgi:hypothetical protein